MASDAKDPSKSPLVRTLKLASLPAGHAARMTWGLGKRAIGAPAGAVMDDVQRRTAEQIFSVLGQLKGGAMKFGQSMSLFEAALPAELAGPYRQALTKLQDAAPSMPATVVETIMEEQFGSSWRDYFVEFNSQPAAAASIGQVHRGKWRSDIDAEPVDVAVKIQYPGAADALIADLKQIRRIARLFGILAPNIDVKAMTAELIERVTEELDYSAEAHAQAQYAAAYDGDHDVFIPRPLDHTEMVLVSEWIDADRSLADIIAHGTTAERDYYGQVYVQFLFSSPARAGLLHADPHPGNFRICRDGRLGVVDFGAVARLPEGIPAPIGPLLRAGVNEDWQTVTGGLRTEGFIGPQVTLDPETLAHYLGPFIEPVMTEEFTFDRAWLRGQGQRITSKGPQGLSTASQLTVPPEYLLIERVWSGGMAVLCQLGTTAPFRQYVIDSVPGFGDDL